MKLLDQDLKPYTLRKEQEECLDFIFKTIEKDKNNKFFMLDLPTGVGKSILAFTFIQRYLKEQDRNAIFDVLTESKILQKQYQDDFNSVSNLSGKNAYLCDTYKCSCEQGKEFGSISGTKCDNCPYDMARDEFMGAKISLTNFHMYTVLRLNDILRQRFSNILIVDEAHALEDVVSDFISVTFDNTKLLKLGFNETEVRTIFSNIKTISDFIEFSRNYFLEMLEEKMSNLSSELESKANNPSPEKKTNKKEKGESHGVSLLKSIETIKRMIQKIKNFFEEYEKNPNNWNLQIETQDNKKKIILEPIWAYPYFDRYIWDHYDKVIMMSGTFLNKSMICYLYGIPYEKAVYYSIDSPFLPKNRPIYYMPLGKMTYREKETTFFQKYIPVIKKILKKYHDKKGMFHSVTFELQTWIKDNIKDERLIYHTSDQESKRDTLKILYTSDRPVVVVSPSMGTGIDLKDDRARFQVLMKMPYPSLASHKNKLRMADNPEWYGWITVAKIIQIYGRSVRNMEDHSDMIILDQSFGDVLNKYGKFVPAWVQRAIKHV